MGLVQLFNVDFSSNSDLFLVTDHLAIAEWIGRVLDVGQRLFGSLPAIEVNFEGAGVLALLSIHLVFEIDQEFLQLINRVASRDI